MLESQTEEETFLNTETKAHTVNDALVSIVYDFKNIKLDRINEKFIIFKYIVNSN